MLTRIAIRTTGAQSNTNHAEQCNENRGTGCRSGESHDSCGKDGGNGDWDMNYFYRPNPIDAKQ